MWHFLLNIILVNCFLLSSYQSSDGYLNHCDIYKQFQKDLQQALFKQLFCLSQECSQKAPVRHSISDILQYPINNYKLIKLFIKQKLCSAYIKAGRKTQAQHRGRKKALLELLLNTTYKARNSKNQKRPSRALRTIFSCSIYQIPFYRKDECQLPYLKRLNSKD